ncbi:MAG: hypothetical protein V1738_01605 [Patescibacteria group bacterium]
MGGIEAITVMRQYIDHRLDHDPAYRVLFLGLLELDSGLALECEVISAELLVLSDTELLVGYDEALVEILDLTYGEDEAVESELDQHLSQMPSRLSAEWQIVRERESGDEECRRWADLTIARLVRLHRVAAGLVGRVVLS